MTRSYIAIYVLLAATFLAILNETVMSVAIPTIRDDLGIPASQAQWVTTAFLLTMAVVIPTTGYLIARFSLRQLFGIAAGLFLAGSILGSIAPTFAVIIAARAIQAGGSAIMMPLLMTTVLRLVPEHERGKMMGNLMVVIAVAPAVGPTISGAILKVGNNNWHLLFDVMIPLALIVLVAGLYLLPRDDTKESKHLDLISVLLSAIGFGSSVFAVNSVAGESGGDPEVTALTAITLALGVIGLVLFVRRQRRLVREDKALLNLDVFRIPSFRVSVILMCLGMTAMFGVIIVLPLYLRLLDVSSLTIGLMLMPGPFVMGLMGRPVGQLYDKIGPRPLVIPGTVFVLAAMAGMSWLTTTTPLWWLIACHITLQIGLGLLFTPLFSWGLNEVPEPLQPDGSAIMSTANQLFGAVGTSIFVTVAALAALDSSLAGTIAGYRVAMLVGVALSAALLVLAVLHVKKKDQRFELKA